MGGTRDILIRRCVARSIYMRFEFERRACLVCREKNPRLQEERGTKCETSYIFIPKKRSCAERLGS